jgi:RNA polymerase sigma factor (sigma-70 family)
MATDAELLRSYAHDRSESAFTELVQRHIDLVYSAALREAQGDASPAEDITQAVFAELARKAASLVRHPAPAGWLYTCVRRMTANVRRADDRRQRREREVHAMNELLSSDSSDPVWRQVQPVLDDAMHELNETERIAVVLRFFEDRSLKEVGLALGINENAARMRLDRALEKLQSLLAKRGVTSAASGLTAALVAGAVASAPTGLAASIVTGALAVTASTSATALTAFKLMTMTKLKIGVISAIAVAGLATPTVIQHQTQSKLREENQSLRQQIDRLAQLKTENERLSNLLAQANGSQLSKDQVSELMKLRGEVGLLRRQTNELGKLREENQRLQAAMVNSAQDSAKAEFNPVAEQGHHIARVAKNASLPLVMYANDHQYQFPTNWDQAAPYFSEALGSDPLFRSTTDYLQAAKEFEIAYQGSQVEIKNPGSVILIRERRAWQTLDGKWAKAYGFADGHGEVHVEPDDNFDAWEKQHMISPAAGK